MAWNKLYEFMCARDPKLADEVIGVPRHVIAMVEENCKVVFPQLYVDFLMSVGERPSRCTPFKKHMDTDFYELVKLLPDDPDDPGPEETDYPIRKYWRITNDVHNINIVEILLDLTREDGDNTPLVSLDVYGQFEPSYVYDEHITLIEALTKGAFDFEYGPKKNKATICCHRDSVAEQREVRDLAELRLSQMGLCELLPATERIRCYGDETRAAFVWLTQYMACVELASDDKDELRLMIELMLAGLPEDADLPEDGLQFMDQYDFEQALMHLAQTISNQDDLAEAYFAKGRELDQLNRYGQAEQCYELALNINPEYVIALVNLGLLCQKRKRLPESLQYFSRAIDIEPDAWQSRYHRALTYSVLDEPQKGLQDWMHCEKDILHFENRAAVAEMYRSMGYMKDLLGDYDEALEYYYKALEADPQDVWLLAAIAKRLQNRGDIDNAILYADRALALDNTNLSAIQTKGCLLGQMNKMEDALPFFLVVYEGKPSEFLSPFNLACAYARLGNVDQAIEYLEIAHALSAKQFEQYINDTDLDNIRDSTGYKAFMDAILHNDIVVDSTVN